MATLFDLTGQVALVTGGNSGIGLGWAEALAEHGSAVAIWGTNAEKNAAAAERLRVHGQPVLALQIDVGDHAAVMDSQNRSLEFAMLLTLPAATALALIPDEMVKVLFQRGDQQYSPFQLQEGLRGKERLLLLNDD